MVLNGWGRLSGDDLGGTMKRILRSITAAALSLGVTLTGLANAHAQPVDVGPPVAVSGAIRTAAVFPWGVAIRMATSKGGCEAIRLTLERTNPGWSKLKCVRSGKIWVVMRR